MISHPTATSVSYSKTNIVPTMAREGISLSFCHWHKQRFIEKVTEICAIFFFEFMVAENTSDSFFAPVISF